VSRGIAVARHRPPDRTPIAVAEGDEVRTGELDTKWPAFRWCVNAGGRGGWVPDRHLRLTPGGGAVAVRDYDTGELALDPGDEVELEERDRESGWVRCRAGDGRSGWVPVECVEERPA
jgi:hypothetical protein